MGGYERDHVRLGGGAALAFKRDFILNGKKKYSFFGLRQRQHTHTHTAVWCGKGVGTVSLQRFVPRLLLLLLVLFFFLRQQKSLSQAELVVAS